ncbi:cytoplasmic protein [Coniophora puteana RWD-64-598 SS2]|uniref:Cytoplasmic protein n=1 Tax=Coniophora puteana (strain RWD-64-598) TaxID=741705 RepID=A0A5M3MVR3_CONPW|nr:cytoplasmic protein [Coniophora puteana RWD-64-598 SS2]EIW83239.1 cytoplasmic protein [Coniophora puteana RWD-64-598 SS2]
MASTTGRKGVWEPLPLIVYGYAVHPLSTSKRDTRISSRSRPLSTVTENSTDETAIHREVVSLEVGDEVYVFEKYTPRGKEVEGVWYRGYVVCTNRRPPVTWPSSSSDPSVAAVAKPLKTEDAQQVFLGIFPASHIFVRDELADAEGRLPDLVTNMNATPLGSANGADALAQWKRDRANSGPEPPHVRDGGLEDERKSFRLGPPPDQAKSSRGGVPVYPASIRSPSPDSQALKPLPPRPSLKSGDETVSGSTQPIVDEIASALREWHSLMFQYLARRDYKLFQTVRGHIEALHLGRRQLLAQTLSADETVSLRRDCVGRLVSGNVIQGLDIIVRHPTWGALVTVDVEGEIDPRSWVSAPRMYSMQVSLAYMDVQPDNVANTSRQTIGQSIDHSSHPVPTPAHPAFPDMTRSRITSRLVSTLNPYQQDKPTAIKFYHIFLDLRAFVASLCAPGETAELFFSIYKHTEARFVTEECCIILNHNGVLARDPNARIRSLFADIAQSDAQDPLYLVCKIVRSGALNMGRNMGSGAPSDMGSRRPSEFSIAEEPGMQVPPTPPRGAGAYSDQSQAFRRPFGCAVLELTQLTKMMAEGVDVTPTREYAMPIYVPTNEALFSMLHQDIIANNVKEYEKSSRAEMLAVSLKVFHGDSPTIIRENMSLLHNIPVTQRLGFPDVVFPGDVRNELYIKLWSGDFSSHGGGGGSRLSIANFPGRGQQAQNVQVSIEVRDSNGHTIENAISMGASEPSVTQFHSMVFRGNSQPTFGELIKLNLPLHQETNWHLHFTFRNRSGRERVGRGGADPDKPFAFAFLPLSSTQSALLEDGSYTLVLYRGERSMITPAEVYLSATPWLLPGQRIEQLAIPPEFSRYAMPMRDTVTLRSSLCSTKFTQNPVLMTLFRWERVTDTEVLAAVLNKFTFVGEGEIVKFLSDIFDSLFGILTSQYNHDGEMDGLIFNALVTVLGIVQDRRFSNFQPVLDVYIEKHFNCPTAASHIIRCMDRLLRNPTGTETAQPLRSALKVWHYIFKFITRSRKLQKDLELELGSGAAAEHLEQAFKKEIRSHLSEVNRMMTTSTPLSIIGTQTIALQNFASILPELAKMFNTIELVQFASNFASAVSATKGKIVIWKLILYLQMVKGFLFDNPQSRATLVQDVALWIQPHFGRFDEYTQTAVNDSESVRDQARVHWLESIRLCVTIMAVMLDKLQQQLVSSSVLADRVLYQQEQQNVEFMLMLVPRLLQSYREFQDPANHRAVERTREATTTIASIPVTFPESYPFSLMALLPNAPRNAISISLTAEENSIFNPGLGESAVVFMSLVLSAPAKHLHNFLEEYFQIQRKDNFANFLSQFFKVATSILNNEAFPSSWLNISVLMHKVFIKMMDPVAAILKETFIPAPYSEDSFKEDLWRDAFYMLFKLLSSDQLVIEDFSPQKRRAVWRLGGDIRGEGADILLRLWEALAWPESQPEEEAGIPPGAYQAVLSSLIGQVVNLCFSHHESLRNNGVGMLYGMIIADYQQFGHFNDIETELVKKLDSLFMSHSKGDDISRSFFIAHLRHLFESEEVDESLRDHVANFLGSVDAFLKLLLSVRRLPEGEEFFDDRVIATLRLMNFVREIGREEMYIKYVHQLVNTHLQAQNYVEAALTLKLHSDLHEWDLHTFVGPMEDLGLPQQSHFHRKETLCLLILDYLGKGKAYETAIEICKELAQQHAEVTFNYARLAEILRHQAALLEHIITDQRYYSDYFRVAFYGEFPDALRNKQFIYRGYEWEKFGAFCERMLGKHPGAQLLKTIGDPPPDIRFGHDQYLQCTAVVPEPDRTLPIFTSPDVPLAIRNYYEHSAINTFSCSREIVKPGIDGAEEIWVEKTMFTTEQAFPTVLRRSDITEISLVETSPVEVALNDIETKTRELAAFHLKYSAHAKTAQVISTNALSMCLNNTVDTPPDSGVVAYREMFLDSNYVDKFPSRAEFVGKLKTAIDDQAQVISSCLKLHGQLCPPEMQPFHDTLDKFFRKNYAEEIRRLRLDESNTTELPLHFATSTIGHEQASIFNHQRALSISSQHTGSRVPLNVGQLSPHHSHQPPLSPASVVSSANAQNKQTPLQRSLTHLARHGLNAVSTGMPEPEENGSPGSPRDSMITVGNGTPGNATPSVTGSSSSFKGRISRFGSLSFQRRG